MFGTALRHPIRKAREHRTTEDVLVNCTGAVDLGARPAGFDAFSRDGMTDGVSPTA